MNAAQLIIHGRVQGVGYRDWLVKMARQRGAIGWVRNRAEGTVEALIAGEQLQELLELCAKGPPLAEVTEIELTPAAPPATDSFERLPTA